MTAVSHLVKIPLLLSAAYFAAVCGKPPHGVPQEHEEEKFAGHESKQFREIFRWLPPLLIMPSMWLTFLCETVAILSHYSVRSLAHLPGVTIRPSPVTAQAGMLEVHLTTAFVVGWILLAAGSNLRLICYRHLGRHFTFELALRKDHKLITTGPYTVVRHPAYTGSVMALSGIALIQLAPGSFWAEGLQLWSTLGGMAVAFAWLAILLIMPLGIIARTSAEDDVLRDTFQEQWAEWARKTPYKLVPGLF